MGTENVSTTRRSATVLKAVMDSINPDLTFEMELEEDFPGNKLPTLDCRVWLETSEDKPPQFNFSFFEKTMNSWFVILEKSAMSYKAKFSILSQEVIRRMLNTQDKINQMERILILRILILMLRSGYNVTIFLFCLNLLIVMVVTHFYSSNYTGCLDWICARR